MTETIACYLLDIFRSSLFKLKEMFIVWKGQKLLCVIEIGLYHNIPVSV